MSREIWQQAIAQDPTQCACRFEWRPTPDLSGAPPVQLDECGFHATHRREAATALESAQAEIARLREDAALWRAFNNGELTYFKTELENRKTKEVIVGEVQWEIYWRGPDKAIFQDAVAALAASREEGKS